MNPLQLFLSYASEDFKIVQLLYKRLVKDGYHVWFDRENLIPGQDWKAEIRQAVKSADVVIVCLSGRIMTKEGYVQKEIQMALDFAGEKPDNTIYLIPIKLEECAIPESLARWHWVNMLEKNGYEKLLGALKICSQRKEMLRGIDKKESTPKSNISPHPTNKETKQYFVGHALTPENILDLRIAIDNGLSSFGYKGFYADRNIGEVQQILFPICKKIYSTDFGIFDISTLNPNVYMEIGIAISLNKDFILIARENSRIPKVFEGLEIILYGSYSSLEDKLRMAFQNGLFKQPPNLTKSYCTLCRKSCDGLYDKDNQKTFIFLDKPSLLWQDISRKLIPIFKVYNFEPIFLTKNISIPRLVCDVRRKIDSARFSILHLGTSYADEISYLALGLMIGSRKPWLLLRHTSDNVPSNIEGFARFDYETQTQFDLLDTTLREFIEEVNPSAIVKDKKTKSISSSFGILLQDWIEDFETQFFETKEIEGAVYLIKLAESNENIQKFPLTNHKTVVGRDVDTSDIVIKDDFLVSSNHISITRSKTDKWTVKDLDSKNGTRINGQQITPGIPKRIYLGDTIRLSPFTKFLFWDKTPPPIARPTSIATIATAKLNLIPINLVDIPHPEDDKGKNTEMILVIRVYSNGANFSFDIQNYYPFGRILKGVSDYLRNSQSISINPDDYVFAKNNKIISNEDTPEAIKLSDGGSITLYQHSEWINQILTGFNTRCEFDPDKPFDLVITFGQKRLGLFLLRKWSKEGLQYYITKGKEQVIFGYETIIIATSESVFQRIKSEKLQFPITITSLNDLAATLQDKMGKAKGK